MSAAKQQGCTTCFDVNYREHLWTPERAREVWQRLLKNVDIVGTSRSVSELVFGYIGTDEAILARYHEEFGCKVVCMTTREIMGVLRGAWSSIALSDGKIYHGKRFEFDAIDRFGTGDAFFAGLLYGYDQRGVEYGLNFGNAMCALAHTIEGDVAHVTPHEVEAILGDSVDLRVRR